MKVNVHTQETTSKGAALFIAVMASFLTPFVGSSVNVALRAVDKDFGLDAITLGWVVTAYLLTAAVFLVPFGRMADLYGRKRIFIYGIIVDAVASIGAALSPSGIFLIVARILQGIGGSMIFGTGIAIVTSVFPPSERGKAIGINSAAVYIGLSVGPPTSGLLTQYLSWRSIFAFDALLGMVIIAAVFWKLKGEWAGAKGEKFDLAGSVIYGLTLMAIMYGFTLLPDLKGLALVGAGVVLLILFVIWENRQQSPVLHMDLFRKSTVFAMSNLAALVSYCATFAVGFLMSLYLQYVKGFSAEVTGLILMSQPVLMAVLSPISGRLSDKIEPRLISSAGMGFSVVALVMLTFIDSGTPVGYILASLAILGIGVGLFSSPNTNAVMSSVGKSFYGVASGTIATMRLVGQMLSLGIVMLMFALFIGQVQITPDKFPAFLTSARTAYIVSAILCFAGIFASLARGNARGATPLETSSQPAAANKP